MKLSTKSTYGLRAMVDIASRFNKGTTSIMDISKKEGISVSYLEQLLNKLRRKGLVRSIRGPKGGYVLSRPPADITVLDVVKTLETEMAPVYCITPDKSRKNICSRQKNCVTKLVWAKLAQVIDDCLESMTLEDLRTMAEGIGLN